MHDRDELGRPLKWLIMEDEFAREGLALEVERGIRAEDVIDILAEGMLIRGVLRHIRSDNGAEFIAEAIRKYLECAGVRTLYIEPGAASHSNWYMIWGGLLALGDRNHIDLKGIHKAVTGGYGLVTV